MHLDKSALRLIRLALLLGAFLGGLPAAAAEPRLQLPLDCRLGETCWVANYVDVDPGPGATDFRCRPRTYDDHKGVDFAIRDLGEMRRGVIVRASAAGTVAGTRDGMPDRSVAEAGKASVAGKECGNGVVIEHGDGWTTQYCHMQRGSIRVKRGDRVDAGTPIGLVGLSGSSEFPHLHISTRHDGAVIDPFTGGAADAGCRVSGGPLWSQPIGYESFAIYNAGLSGQPPDVKRIRDGETQGTTLPSSSVALVLWADIFGVAEGDSLVFQITAPDGRSVLEKTVPVDRTQARRFSYVGIKRPGTGFPTGTYSGTVSLVRNETKETVSRKIMIQ